MSAPAERPGPTEPLDDATLAARPLRVQDDGDKFSRGTVLVVGGSRWTGGAVLLGGLAALRMGAGRLQIATAEPLVDGLGLAVPEAMVVPIGTTGTGALRAPRRGDRLFELAARAQSVVIGPGMLAAPGAAQLVRGLLGAVAPTAMVTLDALAVLRLGELGQELLGPLRGRLILTPNDEELDALVGASLAAVDRVDRCRVAAERHGAVITCFGVVAAPGGAVWESPLRCPGLGTSGSGDVLAGLVGGAAARAQDPTSAACWATHVHLEAGVRLADRCGAVGFLGRELLSEVATVMARLQPPAKRVPT